MALRLCKHLRSGSLEEYSSVYIVLYKALQVNNSGCTLQPINILYIYKKEKSIFALFFVIFCKSNYMYALKFPFVLYMYVYSTT